MPTAYTGEAAEVTSSSATLKGSVYPGAQATSFYFQYGPTASYGAQTLPTPAGSGSQTIHVTATLSALSDGSTYHFRLVVVNPSGTVVGQDRTFSTRRIPLTFTVAATPARDLFASPFQVDGSLSGTGSADRMVVLQSNPFPYLVGFRDIAGPISTDAAGAFSFALPGLSQSAELRVATLVAPLAYSRVVDERVVVRVALHVRAAARPGFARLFGTVAPGQPNALVQFQLLRRGVGPVTVASTVTVGAGGKESRFSRVMRVRHGGFYRVFVLVGGGAQVSNHSRVLRVG